MVEPLLKVTTMVSRLQDKLDDKPYFQYHQVYLVTLKPWLSLLAVSAMASCFNIIKFIL